MITNKESIGYKLAETAHQLAKVKSLGHAKDLLCREMKLLGMVYWEQLAVVETFNYLNSNANSCQIVKIRKE